nr:hypothetical protein [Desulfobacula sp.]
MGIDDGKGPDDLRLVVTGDHLGIGDVVPQLAALPGIDTLGFDKLRISGNFIETEIDINGHPAALVQNIPKQFTAFYLESLSRGFYTGIGQCGDRPAGAGKRTLCFSGHRRGEYP